MKKILAAILSLCIVGGAMPAVYRGAPESVITASASDYEEVVDDVLTYHIYGDHAELTKCDVGAEGEVVIPDKVKGVPVTTIGDNAFRSCASLTSITIPNSIMSIGGYAFNNCKSLKSITIPDTVTSIGDYAFSGSGLTSISIPNSVTSIGWEAFAGCENLTSITIPNTITSIGGFAFNSCKSLKSITIPDTVTDIGDRAFKNCESLESITLPASVKKIGDYAFANCNSLKSITIMNPSCDIYNSNSTINNGLDENGNRRFDGTIRGYEGSTAQKYANKHGYKFEALNKTYPKTTEGFVTRMYNVALNRDPDAAGLKNWVTKLNNHTATAADIINGFFFSNEYQKKNRTADQMIEDCYKAMLDRSPDASGRANWKNRLSVGMSIQSICKGFVGSSEFRGLCDYYKITPGSITPKYARDENYERTYFIYRLYKNCLGRNPSASEVENWCKQIKAGKTGSSIAYGFIFSKEYKGKNVSNSQFVDMLYRTILGRNGDTNGVKSWTAKLNAKATRESVFNGFLFSTEFKNQCDKAGIKVGSKV